MTESEKTSLVHLAIGRIFKMASRPHQEGDVAEYERCRTIILDCSAPANFYEPNWARDRLLGAQGD